MNPAGGHPPAAGRLLSVAFGLAGLYYLVVLILERIIQSVVLDILPHATGFLFAEMSFDKKGRETVNFYSYEQEKRDCFPITARTYLTHKFGEDYRDVVDEIGGDFISCDAAPLGKNGTAVVFESGEMYIFGAGGKLVWHGSVVYRDCPVRDLAVDGKAIWCAVPDCNAVICYSPAESRVTLRIGGMDSAAFDQPVGVTIHDGMLYVANRHGKKVRTIRLSDLEVQDLRKFREPVHKFFISGQHQYAVLDSGVYQL